MNRVIHFEIQATDLDVAQKFYSDVFGWTFQDMGNEYGNYRTIMTGKGTPGIDGGLMGRAGEAPLPGTSVNAFVCIVSVDDIDKYIDRAKKAGGTVALEKMDVPKVGLLVYFKDPDGNTFGMLQPSPEMSS